VSTLVYQSGFSAGLAPDPELTVSEWADRHRKLSSKASAEPGKWRTDRTPYLREIMDSLSIYDPVQRVVFMAGAQVGKTESGNNWLGYVMHHVPGPFLMVQPTVEIAQKVSKQRLAPMIEETPELAALIAPARSRDSGNTLLVKEFRGGVLMLTGANSAAGLRSMPVRFLFCDELDAWPGDVEGEGDPLSLAEKRTTTFARRKVLITSTPTVKDASKVEREYERSDRRRYFVACPDCGHRQWLRWRGFDSDLNGERATQYRLVWLDESKTAAGYVCEGCGVVIEERHKTSMLAGGQWEATSDGDGITRGYHLSALYSPAGWKGWTEILREFEQSSTDPARLKTFVNTVLGETFEEAYSARLDSEGLAKRAEPYELLTAPDKALVITAGVDVQDNRIEVVQRAWGEGEESWLVNHAVVFGDPSRQELWHQVLDILDTPIMHASGAQLVTYAAAIDSGGHHTHEVYAFTRQHRKRHLLAIKGQSLPGKPALGKPTKQDINMRQQTIKSGAMLWPVGSDTIKGLIFGRLKSVEAGPGAYHWPIGLSEQYWKQLTSEKQITKLVNGFPKRIWVKRDRDSNEALDCEVYAYAALQYIYTRHNRTSFWSQMRDRLQRDLEVAESAAAVSGGDIVPVMGRGGGSVSLNGWRRG
jgi:phage terminase large subunit GpA-like protein